MKILIIKLSSIGDVAHTLPCLSALRSAYPHAKIDWLVEEGPSEILNSNPLLNEAHVIKKRGWFNDFKGSWSIAKKIQSIGYDIVIDFQGLFKSGIWVFLSRGKRRVGYDKSREFSYLFLNERLPQYNPDRHAVDRYLDVVKYLGLKCDIVEFPIYISEHEKKRVGALLKSNDMGDRTPFLVVNPVARWKTKLWGARKFVDLCNKLTDKLSCKIVIIGASSEGEIDKIMRSANNNVVNFAGRLNLKELAYIMSLSSMVITVDSGPMHIAAAMSVPVIAIFGPTAPWRTGPYGKGHTVIRKELSCSPCFSRSCNNNMACMEDIEVGDVVKAVENKFHVLREKVGGLHFTT